MTGQFLAELGAYNNFKRVLNFVAYLLLNLSAVHAL
jgi:hypothetical protein